MKFKELSKAPVNVVEEEILKSWGGINEITKKQNELRKNNPYKHIKSRVNIYHKKDSSFG